MNLTFPVGIHNIHEYIPIVKQAVYRLYKRRLNHQEIEDSEEYQEACLALIKFLKKFKMKEGLSEDEQRAYFYGSLRRSIFHHICSLDKFNNKKHRKQPENTMPLDTTYILHEDGAWELYEIEDRNDYFNLTDNSDLFNYLTSDFSKKDLDILMTLYYNEGMKKRLKISHNGSSGKIKEKYNISDNTVLKKRSRLVEQMMDKYYNVLQLQ